MSCPPSTQLFWHRHGELPARERGAVERHLAVCPACRKRYADTTRLAIGLSRNLHQPGSAARTFALPRLPSGRGWVGLSCIVVIVLALLHLQSQVAGQIAPAPAPAPEPTTLSDACKHFRASPSAYYHGYGGKQAPYPGMCLTLKEKDCL